MFTVYVQNKPAASLLKMKKKAMINIKLNFI